MIVIPYRLLTDLPVPEYKTSGSSGMDLYANETVIIQPGGFAMIRLGIEMEIPFGYEGQIRPRSSVSKKRIYVAFGTLDADYRGEVGAVLVNLGQEMQKIERGERPVQIVFAKVERADLRAVEKLSETARGRGGWGSTGR